MEDLEKVEKCCNKKFVYLNTKNTKTKVIKEICEYYSRIVILFEDSTYSLIESCIYSSGHLDFCFPIFNDLCTINRDGKYSLTVIGKLLDVDISKWKEIKENEINEYEQRQRSFEYVQYLKLKEKFEGHS